MLYRCKKALKIALDYIKNPYSLLTPTVYSDDAHDHICFARRLMGSDFKDVCPHYNMGKIEPEWSDCCDWCKYMGVIDFYKDKDGCNSIRFAMHRPVVEILEDIRHEEI